MSAKLQQEIYNFIALKMKLAFAKSGAGIGTDRTSSILTEQTAHEFFRAIEKRVSAKEEESRSVKFSSHESVQNVFEHVLNTRDPRKASSKSL